MYVSCEAVVANFGIISTKIIILPIKIINEKVLAWLCCLEYPAMLTFDCFSIGKEIGH